ncbi:prolipoprotein diacylglyceryl transferase [Alphaproteobacteria bacterium]|nr:prolipoprotein diacylglyceryl transferase [Alphaproteobacteria bacterium]
MALAFPEIDPVAIRIGSFGVRWYALAYMAGLFGGWGVMRALVSRPPFAMTRRQLDDFLLYVTLGVVLGGRLGYVLFYKPSFFLQNPVEIVKLWEGGMSFHGGLLGVFIALVLFVRAKRLDIFAVGDVLCAAAPLGLFFGRIANFINSELYGRETTVPWAVIFPYGGPVGRHPSQLYEALLEGFALFVLLLLLWLKPGVRLRSGLISGVFLIGYGAARIFVEFFRQPDAFLGFLWGSVTMGQLLSAPLILSGVGLVFYAAQKASPEPRP